MGTASIWKLLMLSWSYENGLAIPEKGEKRSFTGGLSRILKVGYSKDIVKLDYASLYPSIMITHGVYPECDVSGAMHAMLQYLYMILETNTRISRMNVQIKEIKRWLPFSKQNNYLLKLLIILCMVL